MATITDQLIKTTCNDGTILELPPNAYAWDGGRNVATLDGVSVDDIVKDSSLIPDRYQEFITYRPPVTEYNEPIAEPVTKRVLLEKIKDLPDETLIFLDTFDQVSAVAATSIVIGKHPHESNMPPIIIISNDDWA